MRRFVLAASALGLLLCVPAFQGCGDGKTTGMIEDSAERKKVDSTGGDAMKEFMQSKMKPKK